VAPFRVLIVDDDPAAQRLLNLHLRAAGFETFYAADAIGAVALAVKERPDAVVLDLGLPAGGGMAVMDRLANLSATATTPVVVVSGQGEVEEREALEKGAISFLRKPVEGPEVVDAVRASLGLPMSEEAGGSPEAQRGIGG
jgi:DNA-binding response OmpR family regulator